jgi:hypothetical protein
VEIESDIAADRAEHERIEAEWYAQREQGRERVA